jgi:hypothetical protein
MLAARPMEAQHGLFGLFLAQRLHLERDRDILALDR